jgi:hypothetical protein
MDFCAPTWSIPPTSLLPLKELIVELHKSEAAGILWSPGWDEFFWKIGSCKQTFDMFIGEYWVKPEVLHRTKRFRFNRNLQDAALSVRYRKLPTQSIIAVGNVRLLKESNACPMESDTFWASSYGQLQCLAYVHENKSPWHPETTFRAAAHGHFSCMVYAYENGAAWHENTLTAACQANHFECLVYAHQHGAEWTNASTLAAATNGHYRCLEYAHRNGARLHALAASAAAANGHFQCATYVLELQL